MSQRITGVRTAHKGFLKVEVCTVETGAGEIIEREVLVRGPAVGVLPYDAARRTALLVRLPRVPVMLNGGPDQLMEAIAGLLEDDSPDDCARREAMEEAGVRLGDLEPVGEAYSSPGAVTEVMHLFLAPYAAADRVEQGGGVDGEHEEITVVELPLSELWAMAEAREIADLKTLTLVLALKARRPDLF